MRMLPASTIDFQHAARRPRGYTLLELMIVLAILAAIAGISWPALMRPWSRSRVQQAAQQVIGHMLEARTCAVEESRVYRLRWRPGTAELQIDAPYAQAIESPAAAPITDITASSAKVEPAAPELPSTSVGVEPMPRSTTIGAAPLPARPEVYQVSDQLENGVRFSAPSSVPLDDPTADIPTADLPAENDKLPAVPLATADGQSAVGEILPVDWSEPVWFYPDGRTSSARCTLISDDGYQVEVVLRGLTGTARLGPVRRAPPQDGQDESALDDPTEPGGSSDDPLTADRTTAANPSEAPNAPRGEQR